MMKALLYIEHLGTNLVTKGTSVITKKTSEGLSIPPPWETPTQGAVSVQVKPASEDTNDFVPQPQISAFVYKD